MADKKILYVDDEIHILHLMRIKLQKNGFKVITADNGEGAFELAVLEKPDIIISDVQIPIMTGIEFVKKLQTKEETKNIPVILITGEYLNISSRQLKSLNVKRLFSKPFNPREVMEAIEYIICAKTLHK